MWQSFIKNEANRILYIGTEAASAFAIMMDNKVQMDKENVIGSDNYFHHKACMEAAQRSLASGIAGQFFGLAKEGIDIVKKFLRTPNDIHGILTDCNKDIKNNFQGFIDGIKTYDEAAQAKIFNVLRKLRLYK